jgi:hypothetical protein
LSRGGHVLYEFAMPPGIFDVSVIGTDEAMAVRLIELLKGIGENGLIASLYKGRWHEHVRQRVGGLRPDLRKDLELLLERLHDRNRLVRHPKNWPGDTPTSEPADDDGWLALALRSHQRIPFHGIIISQRLALSGAYEGPPFLELSDVLRPERWESRSQSRRVGRCEHGFRHALAPMLRHAKTLSLIDPNMSPRAPRFMNTVRICMELMGQRGHETLPGEIRIHAGDPVTERVDQGRHQEHVANRLGEWERGLQPLVAGHPHKKVEILLWRERAGRSAGEDLHNRYILTKQCGVVAPAGLDCPGTGSDDWSLLPYGRCTDLLTNFNPVNASAGTGPFELLAYHRIGSPRCPIMTTAHCTCSPGAEDR